MKIIFYYVVNYQTFVHLIFNYYKIVYTDISLGE